MIRYALRLVPLATGAGLIAVALSADAYLGGTPGLGSAQIVTLGLGAICLLLPFGAAPKISRLSLVVGTLSIYAAVGFAACEVALRITLGPTLAAAYELDPTLLYRHIPGSTSGYRRNERNGGGLILTHINQYGFRGDERRPPADGHVAVVYGDSFIEGYFSPLEQTFPYQLQGCLNKSLTIPIEVLNAGVRGYGPDQVLLRMTQEVPQLRPSLVVVALYAGNDFGDLLRNQLFRVGAGDSLVALHPDIAAEMQAELQFARHAPYVLKAIRHGLVARHRSSEAARIAALGPDSASARQIESARTALRDAFDAYQAGLRSYRPIAGEFFIDREDFDFGPGAPEEASAKLTLMHAVLAALVKRSAQSGVPMLFVIIPSPVDLLPDYDVLHVDRRRNPTFHPNALTENLDSVLTDLGAWHINLEPPFRAQGAETLFMHVDDAHWSDAGQSLAADIACREILTAQRRNAGALR